MNKQYDQHTASNATEYLKFAEKNSRGNKILLTDSNGILILLSSYN